MKRSSRAVVYKLVDPETNAPRYVGRTTKPLAERLGEHVGLNDTGGKRKKEWVRGLVRRGLKPLIVEIAKVRDEETPLLVERYWIQALRAEGCALFNANTPSGAHSFKGWKPGTRFRAGDA